MKIFKIVNSIIPVHGYVAMTTLMIVWIRKEYKDQIDEYTIRHESIHAIQQCELFLLGSIIGLITSLITCNWWWMLLSIGFALGTYVLCWLIEILLPPYSQAYKNICFESEAIYNEGDPDALKKRKFFTFRFLKYISNKKYPYLSHAKRIDIWK